MNDLWPFRCPWCGSTLNSLGDLNEHEPCVGIDAYHDRNPGTDGRSIDPDGRRIPLAGMKAK